MWKSIIKNKPPEKLRVKLKHKVMGIGAPEREGWESSGFIRNDRWTIEHVKGIDFDKESTHWDYI